MDQESIVYGCIKDLACEENDQTGLQRRSVNREVMLSLPAADEWPFLSREMFSVPTIEMGAGGYQTEVMHFGASYKAVEYEWEQWIAKFEEMLEKMFWVSATVHLETELSGTHTFIWESKRLYHEPNCGDMEVRCEWAQDGSIC